MTNSRNTPGRLAVVVTFEKLAARGLGCYGNDWIETPTFDQLADCGVVFHRHYADNLNPAAVTRGWFCGSTTFHRTVDEQLRMPNRLEELSAQSIAVHPFQESALESSAQLPLNRFPLQRIDGQAGFEASPREIPFARMVKAAQLALTASQNSPAGNELYWLASQGVAEPWQPPREMASLYFDEFEERGWRFDQLSDAELGESWPVYGSCVSLLDHWLGELWKTLQEIAANRPVLLIVTAAEGSNLASIQLESSTTTGLSSSRVQTPCVVWWGNDARWSDSLRGNPCAELVQTTDLPETLADWFEVQLRTSTLEGDRRAWRKLLQGEVAGRDRLHLGTSPGNRAVAERNWYALIETPEDNPDSEPTVSLFVKPDDHWDTNDVAGNFPEEAERFAAIPSPGATGSHSIRP